ncbi:MAG TPA: beta-N-acetylhexosaminidase [Xanthobacteraceae bacterium]|nr:beta-N-acetylhexosaminidase [Xanthobacteraceae bacterium]
MGARAFIAGGVAGPILNDRERAFFREAEPWGLILFKRNIETPDQVRRLTESFRTAVGRADAPVLVDQEGGRVQRLGPPHWPAYPPGAAYGRLYDRDADEGLAAARLGGRLIAADLAAVGIDVDCCPVADVPVAGADAVIGGRAYGTSPDKVAAIAGAIAAGLREGGVLPVVKHVPGHGRAMTDSHYALPVVSADRATLEATDFKAFRLLAGLPLAMTAHVVFTAFDPVTPATTSATMVRQVIRGLIGFDGVLMTDDIAMQALSGGIAERSRAALAAGCDVVLQCNGSLDDMEAVAAAVPPLTGEAARRAAGALAWRRPGPEIDLAAARRRFAAMMARAGADERPMVRS